MKNLLISIDGSKSALRALRYALEGMVMGSVTHKVVHLSPLPVILVK